MTTSKDLAAQVEATMVVIVHLRSTYGTDRMLCGRSVKLVKVSRGREAWVFKGNPAALGDGLVQCPMCLDALELNSE